ncbi:hypothetical protein TrLO_g2902 [Triparma laevis f. longispina]|uniref:Uncharacterized protein n=1 Tax=Triparma laevis f. longispina TaxID=1714387 RepID=A0A9W7AHA5_9STRA|nr:hypothetical protein TrLO_g2902 [Triparma laevis f. longispina]
MNMFIFISLLFIFCVSTTGAEGSYFINAEDPIDLDSIMIPSQKIYPKYAMMCDFVRIGMNTQFLRENSYDPIGWYLDKSCCTYAQKPAVGENAVEYFVGKEACANACGCPGYYNGSISIVDWATEYCAPVFPEHERRLEIEKEYDAGSPPCSKGTESYYNTKDVFESCAAKAPCSDSMRESGENKEKCIDDCKTQIISVDSVEKQLKLIEIIYGSFFISAYPVYHPTPTKLPLPLLRKR